MIVAPTPTNPRSPLRRGLRVLGVAVPVALLVGAVGLGLAGPQPVAPVTFPVPTALPAPVARATSGPTATAPPATPAPRPDPDVPPTAFDGIEVEVLDPRAIARAEPDVVVALAGRLVPGDPRDAECPGAGDDPLGPWCERRAWLATTVAEDAVRPPHLRLVVPAGVRMPATRPGIAPDDPSLVVVLARWLPEREACADNDLACLDELVVERFAWSDGVRVGLTPLLDERLEGSARRPNPFTILTDDIVPLSALLTWPESLPPVEERAAEAASRTREGDPVWYLRVAVAGDDGVQTVRWAVLAEHDLGVLGAGPLSHEARDDRTGPG